MHVCPLSLWQAAVAEAAKTGPGAVHVVDYDGDTWVSAGSLDAAKASAGLVDNAITSVLTEDGVNSAYCLTRPPGTPFAWSQRASSREASEMFTHRPRRTLA